LMYFSPNIAAWVGPNADDRARQLRRAIDWFTAGNVHRPQMIGREHVSCSAGKHERLTAVSPRNHGGSVGDFRDPARPGSTTNINTRVEVMVADLRRLSDHCDLGAVRRPGNINDGVEFGAPPGATLRSTYSRH